MERRKEQEKIRIELLINFKLFYEIIYFHDFLFMNFGIK